jgi:dipeptidyl aminopeptidase/acylaminoacyl peptidase
MQYFATSGFAVASVEYRGSTGYGAAYRRALYGHYGERDVDDVLEVARFLVGRGEVDASAVFVRGGSSGGMTALLCAEDALVAGAIVLYPVTDLRELHSATHEAESGYLEDLVGRLPDAAETFRALSPRFRDRSPQRILIFQGSADAVVPASIVREYVEEMRRRNVVVDYYEFEGEGHGFRAPATRETVATTEIAFLRA